MLPGPRRTYAAPGCGARCSCGHVLDQLVKNKAYRSTPIGGEVGRFLRSMRWSDKADNSIDTYEIALARLAYDFAHLDSLDQVTTEMVRDFLDEHWGEAAPATRRNRLAIVKSFFAWAVEERGLGESPPRRSSRRNAPTSNAPHTHPKRSTGSYEHNRRYATRSRCSSSDGSRSARTSSDYCK
jgi:hypothetical protein